MDIRQRIDRFNRENSPFYIVDHDSGRYSLCLALSFLPKEYEHFGQEAFNRYAVRTSAELKETLLDEGGIPADLVFVEAHRLSDLPQMSFFSPADDHESTVVFSPDLFPDDGQVSGFYAMVDGMLEKKRQQTEKIWKLFEKENGDCEVPMKG